MATATSGIWISSSGYIKTEPNEKIEENQFYKEEKSLSGSPSLESKNHHNNDNTVETYKESLNDFLSAFKCYQDGQTTALNQHIGATHLRSMIALSKVSSAEQQALFQEILKKTLISEGGSVEMLKRFILDSTGLEADEKEFCKQQISRLFPETSSPVLDPVNKELKNDSGSTNEPDVPPAPPSLPGEKSIDVPLAPPSLRREKSIDVPPAPPSLPAPPSSDGGGLLERVYTKVTGVMKSVKDSYVDVHGRASNAQKDYSKEFSEINRMEQWIDNTDKSGEKVKFKAGGYLNALEELKKRYGVEKGAKIVFKDPNKSRDNGYVNVNQANNDNASIEVSQYNSDGSYTKKKVLYPTVASEVNARLTKKEQMTNLCNDLGLSPEKSLVEVEIWDESQGRYQKGYIIVANPSDIDTLIKSVKETFPEITEDPLQKDIDYYRKYYAHRTDHYIRVSNQYQSASGWRPLLKNYLWNEMNNSKALLDQAEKDLQDAISKKEKQTEEDKERAKIEKINKFHEIDIQKFGPLKTTGTTMTDNALGDTRQSAQKLSQAHSIAENLYKVLANACQMIAEALIGIVRNW
ncbi:IpaD/SipD/SspD family type III secretion system needle tip protein [Candidatus Williamhamiltonella defendens]|uniref:IpaD/SipD/SspD family type III secretion system needle tip protein n=1 Tax=Candidatus Williamhamiltonella defendens TaxID=138072 RepID=UPI00073FD5AB|nr:IpaD/SipD/SspD family type III secretion system needle tip protein [Candidatus Hamiltonella defensa]